MQELCTVLCEPGKAVITGAEIVDNWENLEGDVDSARFKRTVWDYNHTRLWQ